MRRVALLVASLAVLASPALARGQTAPEANGRPPKLPAEEIRPRVEHHLQRVDEIIRHFEAVLADDCPRFATPAEWTAWVDGEVDRMVLLLAHLARAWREATRTGDDDVRRSAKAPRRRRSDVDALVAKLQGCAAGHGAALSPASFWRRIEREVAGREAEVALPRQILEGDLTAR